jgi:hypothetical protein
MAATARPGRGRAAGPVGLGMGLAAVAGGLVLLTTGGGAAPSPAGAVPASAVRAPASHASAVVAPPVSRAATPPVRLDLPSLHVTAAVQPVGVYGDGSVDVPPDVRAVGWVATTGRPGEAVGTAVIVGHVDGRSGQLGALAGMGTLRMGARVQLQAADGVSSTYVVKALRVYRKTQLPRDLFTARGRPRLALVTCTGPFDRGRQAYPDNLVVYAVPAG